MIDVDIKRIDIGMALVYIYGAKDRYCYMKQLIYGRYIDNYDVFLCADECNPSCLAKDCLDIVRKLA